MPLSFQKATRAAGWYGFIETEPERNHGLPGSIGCQFFPI